MHTSDLLSQPIPSRTSKTFPLLLLSCTPSFPLRTIGTGCCLAHPIPPLKLHHPSLWCSSSISFVYRHPYVFEEICNLSRPHRFRVAYLTYVSGSGGLEGDEGGDCGWQRMPTTSLTLTFNEEQLVCPAPRHTSRVL